MWYVEQNRLNMTFYSFVCRTQQLHCWLSSSYTGHRIWDSMAHLRRNGKTWKWNPAKSVIITPTHFGNIAIIGNDRTDCGWRQGNKKGHPIFTTTNIHFGPFMTDHITWLCVLRIRACCCCCSEAQTRGDRSQADVANRSQGQSDDKWIEWGQ